MSEIGFWHLFGAVLAGNIMTGCFFWGLAVYAKLGRENRVNDVTGTIYTAIFMPLVWLVLALYVAVG